MRQVTENRNSPDLGSSASVRREIIDHALRQLPIEVTLEERVRAIEKARGGMRALDSEVTEVELIHTATKAVQTIAEECRHRVRRERWLGRVPNLLYWGALDEDKNSAIELTSKLLKELPLSLSDWEVEQKVREKLAPISKRIELRYKRKQLIELGQRRVGVFLWQFHEEEAIDTEEWLDFNLRRRLEQEVTIQLQKELTGLESNQDVDDLVESIVMDELDLEFIEDESDAED